MYFTLSSIHYSYSCFNFADNRRPLFQRVTSFRKQDPRPSIPRNRVINFTRRFLRQYRSVGRERNMRSRYERFPGAQWSRTISMSIHGLFIRTVRASVRLISFPSLPAALPLSMLRQTPIVVGRSSSYLAAHATKQKRAIAHARKRRGRRKHLRGV